MFCSKCGNQFADGSAFCPSCGQPVNAAPQQPAQPQQPVYQQPVYQQPQYQQPAAPQQTAPAGDWVATVKKNLALILLIIGCFGALMFFLNTFQLLDLNVSLMGQSVSRSVSDIAEACDDLGESFVLGYIANIIIGGANLAAAAIGILYFLKEKNNMPYYDQFIAKNLKGFSPMLAMGVIGAAGAVLQFILMMLSGVEVMGMSASVSVHWLTWVSLVIYGGIAVVDYLFINKKN